MLALGLARDPGGQRLVAESLRSAKGVFDERIGNTPLNIYKHFCHEGGVSAPLLVSWPAGLKARADWMRAPANVMDLLPTVAAATGAAYPSERAGEPVRPASGRSLLPDLRGETMPERGIPTAHQGARGYRLGKWKSVWGKRQAAPVEWQLFDLSQDPSEQRDLAAVYPEKLKELADAWMAWVKQAGVDLSSR